MALRVGTGLPNIQRERLNAFEFDIPTDNAEQKQLVSAFTSIDTHISALQSLIAKYEAIKKATVNLLIGDFQRRDAEAQRVKLGEVADISRGGSPRPIQDYMTSDSDGINWIKIGDVAADAKYIEKTEERIKPAGVAMSRQVKAGDFILSNSMSFGRPYILKIDGCIHDGWLAIQNYQNTFDVNYLYYLLGSDMVFKQYIENAAGSSVKNLNKDIVAKITLPAPPLPEQRKIASQIAAIDKVLNDCKKQLDKAKNLKQGMMSYFFG
jgi:type I restriction enzyme S subunit